MATVDPAIIVRDTHTAGLADPYTMAYEVLISGPCVLRCGEGQSVWIETDGPIELVRPMKGLDQ